MGRVFFGVAALFFFFAAVGVTIVPNPTAWGLVMTAIGLAIGGWSWAPWKRPAA
jgi:hypothetical protein